MFVFALVFFVAAFDRIEATESSCEKVENLIGAYVSNQCCFLNEITVIDAMNVTINGIENPNVDAIMFTDNKNIQFLPVNINKKFPNLVYYFASNAAIEKISALNFRGLSNLANVNLAANRIESVPDYCFEGLYSMMEISFADNKISSMNGVAFANLPGLNFVNLLDNVCVNREFEIDNSQNLFRRKVSRNCAPAGDVRKELVCSENIDCDAFSKGVFVSWYGRTPGCCRPPFNNFTDSLDFSFTAGTNADLEIMIITRQKNMEFLPVLLHERLPKLKFYFVIKSPIRKIYKKNFEKMKELSLLVLRDNQIEMIPSDTFEDLVGLKRIYILKQRLTSLNSHAFAKLTSLDAIHLNQNYCIDDEFQDGPAFKTAFEAIASSCGYDEIDSVEVVCERYQNIPNEYCLMNERTAINATNFVMGELRDEEVEGIVFDGNKKIEYIPYKIHMQFPNLAIYHANRCSIKQISKENFENLRRLKSIELASNKIQKLAGNTFKGLEKLTKVDLNSNQIKSINGRTFDQLPMLTVVDLSSNECIDEKLGEGQSMKNFTRKIIQNCAFTETGERDFEKVFDIECGVGMRGTGFIVGGSETKRGQWPFMAALIFEPSNQFFCGGNVITTSHVLTAAHCVCDKHMEQPLEASQIVVLLGRHNISLRAEVGSEVRGVKEIKVHPRWNSRDMKFEGDIAVLQMDRPVQFSELIQPVCLTVEPEISQLEAGYVIGWGKSESLALHENVPRQVLISSVTTDVCFAKDFKLGEIFAQGMYCAGGDGVGPCNGDSGGGFFVRYHGLWTLRGVVSSGSLKFEGGCDVERYSLFTNVLDYTAWVNEVVKVNATSFSWRTQITGSDKSIHDISKKPIEANSRRVYVRRDQYF